MTQSEGSLHLNLVEKIIVATSAMTVTVVYTAVTPMLPKIQEVFAHYPHAPLLVKMLMGAIGAAMVVGGLTGGWLAKRFSHRMLLCVGYVAYAFMSGLGLLATDLYILLATRCAVGFVASVTSTVVLVMLTQRAREEERNMWLGLVVSIAMATGMISYPIAGFLGDVNWRLPYVMYLFTLPLAVACFFIRDVQPSEAVAHTPHTASANLPYRLIALAFLNGLMGFLPNVYLPYHLDEANIKDPRVISLILTAALMAGAVLSGLYGHGRRLLSVHQSLTLAYLVATTGVMVVALSSSITLATLGMLVFGCGLAWLEPNLCALVSRLPDDTRAAGFGMTKAAGYAAPLVGVLILEPVYRAFGANGVLISVGLLGLSLLVLVQLKRGPFSDHPQTALAGAPQ